MNILATCTSFNVNLSKIPTDIMEKVKEEYEVDPNQSILIMSEDDCNKLNIPEEAIDYESQDFDEDGLESLLEIYVGKHPFYLAFGERIRWNSSGYIITEDIKKTVLRSHDVTITTVEEPGNDTLICLESSHDVPTGARLIIKGLTAEEAEQLEDCDFNEIEAYINKFVK